MAYLLPMPDGFDPHKPDQHQQMDAEMRAFELREEAKRMALEEARKQVQKQQSNGTQA